MKSTIKTLVLVISATGLTACASTPQYVSHCTEIHTGMTYDQVTEILGQPVKKSVEAQTTAGVLQAYYYAAGNHVQFTDGKVSLVSCK